MTSAHTKVCRSLSCGPISKARVRHNDQCMFLSATECMRKDLSLRVSAPGTSIQTVLQSVTLVTIHLRAEDPFQDGEALSVRPAIAVRTLGPSTHITALVCGIRVQGHYTVYSATSSWQSCLCSQHHTAQLQLAGQTLLT